MARWDDGGVWDDGGLWDEVDDADLNILWQVYVDWHNTGGFDPTINEWQYARHVEYEVGRMDYIRIQGEENDREAVGFYYIDPGRGSITFDNRDDRYNPRNESSPLYPNVRRGRLVQVSVWNGVFGTRRDRFTGYIEDIELDYENETATFTLVDPMNKLAKTDANIGLQQNIKISEAIDLILDYVSWPLGRNIESTTDNLSYWWTRGRRALSEIRESADGDLGTFFVAGNGAATFYTRNHASSVAVNLSEADVSKNIRDASPWDVICNLIEATVSPLQLQATGVLWELIGDTPYFAPGQEREYFCPLQYNGQQCPADNIIEPVGTTDYTANTASDGSGTDKTSNFSVTKTELGIIVKLTVKNNGGPGEGAYLRTLQVRGDAITTPNPVTLVRRDQASIDEYGSLRFRYSSPWLQNLNVGESVADLLKLILTNPLGFLVVEMDTRPDKQFAAGLFDNAQVDFDRLGASASMRVGYYRDEWFSPTGQAVKTTMKLEPPANDGGDYFRFDVSELDVDALFGP